MRGIFKSATFVALATVLGIGAAANATVNTVDVHSGGSYDGWKIYFPEGEGVSLVQDVQTNTLSLVLEKSAVFTNNTGFLVSFMQDKKVATPATSITIANESITNNTGTNWGGFIFHLATPFAGPQFAAGHAFAPPAGYTGVVTGPKNLIYTGSQADGTTSLWNQTPPSTTNNIVINSDPLLSGALQNFTFKEIPIVGPAIPLPAAAWTSLSLLGVLGLIANRKSIRRIFG